MEKLRKVRSLGELRPGMIVLIRDCASCGKTHRKLVLNFDPNALAEFRGEVGVWDRFKVAPSCDSIPDHGISTRSIVEGRIFIVEDGLESSVRESKKAQAAPWV